MENTLHNVIANGLNLPVIGSSASYLISGKAQTMGTNASSSKNCT